MDYSVELSKFNGIKMFDNIDYEITRKNILEFLAAKMHINKKTHQKASRNGLAHVQIKS